MGGLLVRPASSCPSRGRDSSSKVTRRHCRGNIGHGSRRCYPARHCWRCCFEQFQSAFSRVFGRLRPESSTGCCPPQEEGGTGATRRRSPPERCQPIRRDQDTAGRPIAFQHADNQFPTRCTGRSSRTAPPDGRRSVWRVTYVVRLNHFCLHMLHSPRTPLSRATKPHSPLKRFADGLRVSSSLGSCSR